MRSNWKTQSKHEEIKEIAMIPNHYKNYTIGSQWIQHKKDMRKDLETRVSFDNPRESKIANLAEQGEGSRIVHIAKDLSP